MAELKEDEKLSKLPFSEPWQQALLGHLIVDRQLFLRVKEYLKPEWFIDKHLGTIWRVMTEYAQQYGTSPSLEEIKNKISYFDNKEKLQIYGKVNICVLKAKEFAVKALADELENWFKCQIFVEGTKKAIDQFNLGRTQEAFRLHREYSNKIEEATLEDAPEIDLLNPITLAERQMVSHERALTFGLTKMDRLILPNNINGALLPGDTTILLAPTNVGKTTAMITIAIHNIQRGKHVLFMFHEGRPEDIEEKIWCCMLDCSKAELGERIHYLYSQKPELYVRITKGLSERLVLLPIFGAGVAVEEVDALVERKMQEHFSKTGRRFDLIVDDYPAKLTSNALKSGVFQKRNFDQYVYQHFVAMALKHDLHVLTAIQTNRTGSKINKGQGDDRLVMMEDVNESFGPMQDVSNVISLNRSPLAEARQRLTYLLCKSRTGETNWAVVCNTNYGHAIVHSDKLGATFYRGTSTMDDKIDALLAQYANNDTGIPYEEITG